MPQHISTTRAIGVSIVCGLAAALATYALVRISESVRSTSKAGVPKKQQVASELPSWAIDQGYLGDDEKDDNGVKGADLI